jgi:uncharacterized protein (TIGR03083 family)
VTEAYDAGWLTGDRYDALRRKDFERFCEAASRDLAARVPTCPEWDVTALCEHLARVYQGRAHVVEHAAFKDQDAFVVRADGEDPIDFVRHWSDELDRVLADLPDDAPTLTFMPDADTILFWRRRMGLETLVHRTDAELATGDASPMDDELSADGIDEMLWFGSHPENDDDDGSDAAGAVALTDGTLVWVARLERRGLTREATGEPDVTVRGTAPALLLSLTGRDLEGIGPARFGVAVPTIDGDPAVFERLLTRLGSF